MKKLIMVCLLLVSSLYAKKADQMKWRSILFNDTFYIQNVKNADLRYPMTSLNMNPEFKGEVLNKNERLSLIIYVSGEAGTSEIVREKRAIIFDKKLNKFLGDFPYQYSGKFKKKMPQPMWVIRHDLISIKDKQTGLDKTILLK